jgi:hypothetical protein
VTVVFVVDLDNGLRVLHTYIHIYIHAYIHIYIHAYIHKHVIDSIWGQNLSHAFSYTFSGVARISTPFRKANQRAPSNV